MCISVFAIAKRDGKVLMGIPREKRTWISKWIPNWGFYSKEDLDLEFERWRLPSAYLLEGEHPDEAIGRVTKEQLGVKSFAIASSRILSYTTPSDWYPGNNHWDLAFAYEVDLRGPIRKLPWWKELGFLGKSQLQGEDFGWNDDLMRDLKLVE